MSVRRMSSAAGVLALLASLTVSGAAAQIRIEVPKGRPSTGDEPGPAEMIGGLLALKDAYDRSRKGQICAIVYNDRNGDGARDKGEGALPGWTLTIADAGGAQVARGVTDRKGRFCNKGSLTPGAYRVTQSAAAGWTNTEPGVVAALTKAVTLPADQSVTVLFGNCGGGACRPLPGPPPAPQGLAQACAIKYNDLNGNGVRDTVEPVLPGWPFTVSNGAGVVVGSGTTDATGKYCTLKVLAPGPYTLAETVLPGWTSTTPGGPSRTGTLQSNQVWTWQFGNRLLPSTQVCIRKFNDLNGDGVRQPGEPGLNGWEFHLVGPNGTGPLLTTGGAGGACFTAGFAPGAWTATETVQPGWTATTPGGATQSFNIVPTQNVALLFGNRKIVATSRICVTKYHDLNNNGARDAGEPLLPGWAFKIVNSAGAIAASGVTGPNGQYCTPATLPAGSYSVRETLQAGWLSTSPGGQSPSRGVNLAVGQTLHTAFGNRKVVTTGQICVSKFHDLNNNGARDAGEPLLPGWTFKVINPAGGAIAATGVTGSDGQYCTPATLPAGVYSVGETLKPGWISTSPGGQSPSRGVTVTAGQITNTSFGNRQAQPPGPGVVCIVKYDDIDQDAVFDATEAKLSGWQFNLKTAAGAAVASVVTGANGRVCRDMPAGIYAAHEVNQPGWSNSDPVGPALHKPFTITAGQTVNLVFGNYQPPRLRIRKVVLSNAPGGGFPLTGLTFGNSFQVLHGCVLGNQTGGSMTNVPANGVAPQAGYTGSSVGAVCTASETPPQGRITFAACATGEGHWDPPLITPATLTIAPGMNEFTVTNRFVCEKAPPPTAPRLTLSKILDNGCVSPQGVSNPCIFRIRIRNVGSSAYVGPASFSDTVAFAGGISVPNSTILTAPMPGGGWTCTTGGPPITCSGALNLAPGQSVDVVLTMNLFHPVMPVRNCATLTTPITNGPACVSF